MEARITGTSRLWYYRALQIGYASKVVPIDKLSVKSIIGCVLIGTGTLVMVL